MFQNIIWDVDGTLFDTYPAMAQASKAALNDFGKDADLGWIESLAKKSLSHCVATLADKFQLSEGDIDQAFGEHYAIIPPEKQPPFLGVIAVCEYICSVGGKNVVVTHRGVCGHAPKTQSAACRNNDSWRPSYGILAGEAAGIFTCLFGVEVGEVVADLTICNFDELYRYLTSESMEDRSYPTL